MRTATVASMRKVNRPQSSTFVMAAILITLGFFLLFPVLFILAMSFNTAAEMFVPPRVWGLDNWRNAFDNPLILRSLLNTLLVWGVTLSISLPISVLIAWVLARTRIPFSYPLEFMFWIAYVTPGTVIAWIILADPHFGLINVGIQSILPFVETGPFDIFSVPGIVWVGLMGNGIALKVMLLTPAFRNMDLAMEDAARIAGASSIRTMTRVTMPLMMAPITLVLAFQLVRIFQSFETEFLLGTPIGFFVYSTLIFDLIRFTQPPAYGQATALAALTLGVIALIIPLQRWVLQRRRYTTITGSFKPGLIDIGKWRIPTFVAVLLLHIMLTVVPVLALVAGSLMTRSGYFQLTPIWTIEHWQFVFSDPLFYTGLRTTLTLAFTTAIISPILFSLLAYILVRTKWRGRSTLDSTIWISAAIPGILSSLGLLVMFLGTPGLSVIYGTIWALVIVVILQGNTTGVNITKASILQVGFDLEEASRVAGAGWIRTYFRIWLPLLMPTIILLAVLNFTIAAGTTASIILLASRETITLSILILELASGDVGEREAASVVTIVVLTLTLGVAVIARRFGLRLGVRHD